MEPADIDWKNLEWRFVRDELYEHFNAPKWVDLSAASPLGSPPSAVPSDEAWFCRPDCRHPKTVEDFLRLEKTTPPSGRLKAKLARAWNSPLDESKQGKENISGTHDAQRDTHLKRRGGVLPASRDSPKSKLPGTKKKLREDLENQDPNLSPATPSRAAKIAKETIKSSAERPEPPPAPERPLRSTLSARNLFAGKDILAHISEFCREIKKLAMPRSENSSGCRADDEDRDTIGETGAQDTPGEKIEKPLPGPLQDAADAKKKNTPERGVGWKQGLENLRLPPEAKKKAIGNLPLLQEVRSCPPTPQRFPSPASARRKAAIFTPVKSSMNPRHPERGVLREVAPVRSGEETKPLFGVEEGGGGGINIISPASAGGKSVDLFWFLKPCTNTTYS